VEAVERAKKQSAMEHWAKDDVDRAFETHKRNHAAKNSETMAAQVTSTGSAVVSSPGLEKLVAEKKKPASPMDMADVRQRIREQIRKGFFPTGVPGSSTPPK
jgi:hypothetical protein